MSLYYKGRAVGAGQGRAGHILGSMVTGAVWPLSAAPYKNTYLLTYLFIVNKQFRFRFDYNYVTECDCACFNAADINKPINHSIVSSLVRMLACIVSYRMQMGHTVWTELLQQLFVFTARCTLVQSAVLRSHVVCLSVCPSVCLSVTLVNCDHIGWNYSKIITPLVSMGCLLFATPT